MELSCRRPLVLVLALEVAAAASAAAETVSIAPKKDNTIYSGSENTNGGGQYLFAGTTITNSYRRAIISFDVAGNVPAGSTIQSATLTLHMSRTNAGAQPVMVHLQRCLRPWGEGTVVGPRGEGEGGPPQPGDATWSFNMFNTSRWSAPGGDYSPASSGSTLVGNGVAFYSWSSPEVAQDVQSWLDGDETNFGWVVLAEGEGHAPVTAKRFDSRENVAPQFRPVLQIIYNPPPPDCDGGLPDGGTDAGQSDAGGIDRSDGGVEDNPGTGPRPDRIIDEIGRGGCQAPPGSALGLLALSLLALTRLRRQRVRFPPGG
jgi:hypothetical protein